MVKPPSNRIDCSFGTPTKENTFWGVETPLWDRIGPTQRQTLPARYSPSWQFYLPEKNIWKSFIFEIVG